MPCRRQACRAADARDGDAVRSVAFGSACRCWGRLGTRWQVRHQPLSSADCWSAADFTAQAPARRAACGGMPMTCSWCGGWCSGCAAEVDTDPSHGSEPAGVPLIPAPRRRVPAETVRVCTSRCQNNARCTHARRPVSRRGRCPSARRRAGRARSTPVGPPPRPLVVERPVAAREVPRVLTVEPDRPGCRAVTARHPDTLRVCLSVSGSPSRWRCGGRPSARTGRRTDRR